MNEKFLKLRNTYKTFIYHDYHIEDSEDNIKITYDFEIVGLCEFHPTIEIKKKKIIISE